jgi:hypothetical protein
MAGYCISGVEPLGCTAEERVIWHHPSITCCVWIHISLLRKKENRQFILSYKSLV